MVQKADGKAGKAVMGFAGGDCGPVRPPINRLQPEAEASLRADLDAMGFFDWARK